MKNSLQPHLHWKIKPLHFVASLFIFIILLSTSHGTPQQRLIKVERVENGNLVYVQYDLKETQTIDLSDLELSDRLTGKNAFLPSPLTSTWSSVPDFKLILLESGLAKLRNPDLASDSYRQAQDKAQKEGKGMWAKPPVQVQSPQTSAPPQQTSTQVPGSAQEQAK